MLSNEDAEVAKKALDIAERFGNFFSKVAGVPIEQAMGILGDKLKFMRYERQIRLMQRVESLRHETGIQIPSTPTPLNLIVPILIEGSLEENDELQELYAHLLVNSANNNYQGEIRRLHVEILKQLNHLEVKILQKLYETNPVPYETNPGSEEDHSVCAALLPSQALTREECAKNNIKEIPQPSGDTGIAVYNLLRVKCIDLVPTWEFYKPTWVQISPIGKSLIEACTLHAV